MELPPGHEPGGLHGLLRDEMVAAHSQADPSHVLVVGRDDAAEGDLVAASRSRYQLDLLPICEP